MALVTALMALLMMLALGAGVAVTTMTEVTIAANHRDGIQALYAAEAGIELALNRLRAADDWRTVLDGRDAVTVIDGGLADLLQSGSVDARSGVIVTVSRDPGEDDNVLVMQSSAIVPGGIRRTVQVIIKRAPSSDDIEIMSWR
jgi:PilX N-terminal